MKDSKIPIILYTIGVVVISIVIGFILGRVIPDKEKPNTEIKKETAITKKAVNPVPVSEKPAGSVSVPVELELKDPDDPQLPKDEILLFKPSTFNGEDTDSSETAPKDTFRVTIPLTQKEYKDSDYTAYVSGFHASLDSIQIRTKVIEYTKTVTKFRRWNIGIVGGYGYGFQSRQLEPFVGVGITWNIFK